MGSIGSSSSGTSSDAELPQAPTVQYWEAAHAASWVMDGLACRKDVARGGPGGDGQHWAGAGDGFNDTDARA